MTQTPRRGDLRLVRPDDPPEPPPEPRHPDRIRCDRVDEGIIHAIGRIATQRSHILRDGELLGYIVGLRRVAGDDPARIVPLLATLERLMHTPAPGSRMPTVSAILAEAGLTPPSDRAVAVDVASRIMAAAARFGAEVEPDGRGGKRWRAEASVGELGMKVVERMFGTWAQLCRVATAEAHSRLMAQIRDGALSVIELSRRGLMDEAPRLPKREPVRADEPTLPKPPGTR